MPIWKRLSKSMEVAKLFTGQSKYEVALHKICAGGTTPNMTTEVLSTL